MWWVHQDTAWTLYIQSLLKVKAIDLYDLYYFNHNSLRFWFNYKIYKQKIQPKLICSWQNGYFTQCASVIRPLYLFYGIRLKCCVSLGILLFALEHQQISWLMIVLTEIIWIYAEPQHLKHFLLPDDNSGKKSPVTISLRRERKKLLFLFDF